MFYGNSTSTGDLFLPCPVSVKTRLGEALISGILVCWRISLAQRMWGFFNSQNFLMTHRRFCWRVPPLGPKINFYLMILTFLTFISFSFTMDATQHLWWRTRMFHNANGFSQLHTSTKWFQLVRLPCHANKPLFSPSNNKLFVRLTVQAEGIITGIKFVYDRKLPSYYLEEVMVAINCAGYAYATTNTPTPTLAILQNGAYFNQTFVTGIPNCLDVN